MTRLVILDCDGVLVDSEAIANRVMAQHISRAGWPLSGTQSEARFKGLTMEQVIREVEQKLGSRLPPSWLERFETDCFTAFNEELQPIDGVMELIRRIHRAGVLTCVASQGSMTKMNVTLRAAGLIDMLGGHIFSAADVGRPKPAPDIFLHAAMRMSTPASQCLVIEDSVTGVKAALAAGMRVIGYDAERTGALAIDPRVNIVHHLSHIEQL
jgi:HAD superfamily hydrolase (TIGR01509 family)